MAYQYGIAPGKRYISFFLMQFFFAVWTKKLYGHFHLDRNTTKIEQETYLNDLLKLFKGTKNTFIFVFIIFTDIYMVKISICHKENQLNEIIIMGGWMMMIG
ncbi:hypothetical protein ACJX0J_006223 [Zea mays]